ncbi:MAG: DUF86 domain-containing protein [Anaerolineales bacterium]|nr:DUF86 domain-containing protein [Anaerolineales bacterium]
MQTWVVYHLQIIGEAARSLSVELQQNHPEIPWRSIIGMRHILVHSYFGIDKDVVWSIVANDLPDLKPQITILLQTTQE